MTATRQQLRDWGRLGGYIRASKLSAKRRSQIATHAVRARERKRAARDGKRYGLTRARVHQIINGK